MEESFDLSKFLRNHTKKHKSKPSQFASVAVGVQKRLETNIKHRRSSRLTLLDNIRNLKCDSPAPLTNAQQKSEHRRRQLELWKEQKEKQRKDAAKQKKKPFLTGVPHVPQKYVPPPPITIPKPSTFGRVTRSQSSKNNIKTKETKEIKTAISQSFVNSFAPKNASFRPPKIKNVEKVPSLAVLPKKAKQLNITFNPILPNSAKDNKQTRSKTTAIIETKPVQKPSERSKAKVTRAPKKNSKLSAAPSLGSSSEEEHTLHISPILTINNKQKSPLMLNSQAIKKTRKSLQKQSRLQTPEKPVPKSESSSEEKLRSPETVDKVPMTPEQIVRDAVKNSPYVTKSRGKDNARKEMKEKLNEGLLDEDASDMDSVGCFRLQLASEIKRMTEMCETWEKISEQTILPDTVQEAVLSAVGQARLLMSQKLLQFSALVDSCANPQPNQPLVTPADLQGFWDMVFMQVENVDVRFKKLEELRSHGWVEQQTAELEVKKKVVKANTKKVVKSTGGPSRLREMIAAARKAKKEQEDASAPQTEGADKTFEAGFFSVTSPIRLQSEQSPASRTPNNNSLLKAVLSSEAKKSAQRCSSFAILRASVMAKNMEYDGIAPIPQTPITPVNLHATPGRSILKASKTEQKSSKKAIKMVLFDGPDAPEIINSQEFVEEHMDSGISSLDHDKPDDKENKDSSKKNTKLARQDAVDWSPILTRSRRKSSNTDGVTPRRSSRKVFQEIEEIVQEKTPRRSTRKSRKAN